jgi:hypothetical protein
LGRHKKLGNETCPDPRCVGFLQLGRKRHKKVRGKRTSRYIDRFYFRHNDSNIPEHYVDNFVFPRSEHADIFAKLAHTFYQIGEQVKTFPLSDDKVTRLNFALRCFVVDIIEPQRHIAWLERMKKVWALVGTTLPQDNDEGWNGLVEELKVLEKDAEKMASLREKWAAAPVRRDLNEMLRTAPLFREINDLYRKYETPKRIAKRKIINEKLSQNYKDGKVGKTDDYTGIEMLNPSLLPS